MMTDQDLGDRDTRKRGKLLLLIGLIVIVALIPAIMFFWPVQRWCFEDWSDSRILKGIYVEVSPDTGDIKDGGAILSLGGDAELVALYGLRAD
ncbi:MAG: hypothetical protein KDB07_12245, partial [Planctomycetes bacterium]|nr:hypothetical protein [Planctomycetota bacterium]